MRVKVLPDSNESPLLKLRLYSILLQTPHNTFRHYFTSHCTVLLYSASHDIIWIPHCYTLSHFITHHISYSTYSHTHTPSYTKSLTQTITLTPFPQQSHPPPPPNTHTHTNTIPSLLLSPLTPPTHSPSHTGTCVILGDRNNPGLPFSIKLGDCFRLGSVGLVVSELRTADGEEQRLDSRMLQVTF